MHSIFNLCATTTVELTWIQHLFCDLQVHLSSPILAYCENIGALYLAHNLMLHSKMKHANALEEIIRWLMHDVGSESP